jgi:hypothetical protein
LFNFLPRVHALGYEYIASLALPTLLAWLGPGLIGGFITFPVMKKFKSTARKKQEHKQQEKEFLSKSETPREYVRISNLASAQ